MYKKIIRIDPVEELLYVYLGKDKNYMDIIHEDFVNIPDVSSEWNGFHAYQELKTGEMAHVICIESKDNGLIFHELIHCVSLVMQNSGIKDEEFMAYMCQHLYYEVVKK